MNDVRRDPRESFLTTNNSCPVCGDHKRSDDETCCWESCEESYNHHTNELAKEREMPNNDKVLATRDEFHSIEEPYGWVKLKDATLYRGSDGYTYVEGTVVGSCWVGAFFAGNAMSKPREKHPVGETAKVWYVSEYDFANGKRRAIAG